MIIQSNLYIKATQENLKTCPLLAVALYTGADPGGVHTTKIGNNKIFWHKIVIFHTKYPNNFRASLRLAQFF